MNSPDYHSSNDQRVPQQLDSILLSESAALLSPEQPPLSDPRTRTIFIKRLYSIICFQLSVIAAFVTSDQYSLSFKDFLMQNNYILWIALILFFAGYFTLISSKVVARLFPLNYLIWLITSISFGVLITFSLEKYPPNTSFFATFELALVGIS
jgi:FtsH-binding integral membrane protein